jgi:uncharacterized protein YjiS (DUF1127 family)
MSTINGTTELGPASAKRQVYSPLETYWNAFQEWRKREKLRTQLRRLTDSELADIGITRGEIDYVASHRGIDPRGIRSCEWLRYLPTVDSEIGPTDFR